MVSTRLRRMQTIPIFNYREIKAIIYFSVFLFSSLSLFPFSRFRAHAHLKKKKNANSLFVSESKPFLSPSLSLSLIYFSGTLSISLCARPSWFGLVPSSISNRYEFMCSVQILFSMSLLNCSLSFLLSISIARLGFLDEVLIFWVLNLLFLVNVLV